MYALPETCEMALVQKSHLDGTLSKSIPIAVLTNILILFNVIIRSSLGTTEKILSIDITPITQAYEKAALWRLDR